MKLRLLLAALSNDKGRKAIGVVLVAIFAPFFLLLSAIASLASGEAQHNVSTVEACFYGTEFSEKAPAELKRHIQDMRAAFSLLDSAVYEANALMEGGDGLDSIRVKAVFLALCYGESAPTARAADRFVNCFYTTEDAVRMVKVEPDEESEEGDGEEDEAAEIEEHYIRNRSLPLSAAYSNLSSLLWREITEEDRENANHIYTMIVGDMGDLTYDGEYAVSGSYSTEMESLEFSNPAGKNAEDLAAYAINAYESGWGYVWGTFGNVLTEGLFASKLEQYPEGVGNYADFIRANWIGRRTTDCVGLIKSYGWYDPETQAITYGSNGMPDIGANQMYYTASESGPIDTIPEIPGLAVWLDGHIGVYIGGGEVIEAMGTRYGVVKTELEGRGWTHWLKIAYIDYD